jgi:hypothetical protein
VEQVPGILKAFVIASGAILVIGAVVLAVLIVVRAMGAGDSGDAAPAMLAPDTPVELTLPAGGRIERVIPDGERVLLLGADRAGAQFLIVVDPETGALLRLIRFRPAPAAR